MEELFAYRADLLTALGGVVDELSNVVANLPPSTWLQPIHPGSRTPHYILFHLRELEAQVFARQLPRILSEARPELPVFNDAAWMEGHYRAEEPASSLLEELAKLRQQELAWLRSLPPAGWSSPARHPWWGEHTLQWWVELQVEYSYQHLKEISSALKL